MNKSKYLGEKAYKSKKAYESFKSNVLNAFHLYGRVFTQKFSKSDNNLIRAMYITYLVSCLENYFTELFKTMFNKKMVNQERIFKIKRIKQLKFNLNDLQEMQNSNLSVADVLAEHMNFQNMKYIYEFAKSIEFNKYSQKVKQTLKIKGNNKHIQEVLTFISKQKNKNLDSLKVSKAINKLIVEGMVDDKILLAIYSADKCFSTIAKMVKMRHEVVHKAKDVKIEHWEIWAYTLASVQFANIFNRIYELKLKEFSSRK